MKKERSFWQRLMKDHWYVKSRDEEATIKAEVEARRKALERRLKIVKKVVERRRAQMDR